MQVVDLAPVDRILGARQVYGFFQGIHICPDRAGRAIWLLVDLLLHEVAVIAFLHTGTGTLDKRNRALNF